MDRDRARTLTDEITRTSSRIAVLEADQEREAQRLHELEAELAAIERVEMQLGPVRFAIDAKAQVVRQLIVLRGGMGAKQTRDVFARMASVSASDERLVLATGRFIGEGFDGPDGEIPCAVTTGCVCPGGEPASSCSGAAASRRAGQQRAAPRVTRRRATR